MIISPIYLPILITALLCVAIISICICRLNSIDKSVLLRVGLQYVFLSMAASGLALAPFVWEFPGWATACFAAAVLFMLVADSYQWKHGPPDAATGPVPLASEF